MVGQNLMNRNKTEITYIPEADLNPPVSTHFTIQLSSLFVTSMKIG